MLVELRVADRPAVTCEIDGEPLIARLAPFRRLSSSTPDRLILDYIPEDGVDKVCGFYSIPFVDGTGGVSVHQLWVAPPPPFSDEEVRLMWDAILDLDMGVPAGLRLQGSIGARTDTRRLRAGEHPRDELLASLTRSAAELLANWPQRDVFVHHWRPVGLAGGVEDVLQTVRHGWRAGVGGVSAATGRMLPERSARRSLNADGWSLSAVARLANAVGDVVAREYENGPALTVLEHRLRLVANQALPSDCGAIDPPTSSWPKPLLHFAEVAWRFLNRASDGTGPTPSSLPLCEVWRLYERWTAAHVARSLTKWFGAPSARRKYGQSGERWLMVWNVVADRIVVEAQYAFGHSPGSGLSWRSHYRSVTAQLVPDVLMVLERENGGRALLLVDAKERSASFGTDDAAAAGAKYLWGIRNPDFTFCESPIEVVLATSRPVSAVYRPAEARISFANATPAEPELLDKALGDFLYRHGGLAAPAPGE